MKVRTIGYVLVCLTMTPFLISIVVFGGCTPRQVMFAVLEGARCVVLAVVKKWEDARGVIVVSR